MEAPEVRLCPTGSHSVESGARVCHHVGMKRLMLIAAAAAVLAFGVTLGAQDKKADKATDGKKKDAEAKGSGGASKGSNEREKAAEAKEVPPARPAKGVK